MSEPLEEGATFKLRIALRGRHVVADLFVGKLGTTLAHTGTLTMTAAEWQCFESALLLGARRVPFGRVVVLTEGAIVAS